MSNSESPGCLGALFLLFRNPKRGESGSLYQPAGSNLRSEIPVDFGDPDSAWSASFERTADNLDDLGAHDLADRVRKKVSEFDSRR